MTSELTYSLALANSILATALSLELQATASSNAVTETSLPSSVCTGRSIRPNHIRFEMSSGVCAYAVVSCNQSRIMRAAYGPHIAYKRLQHAISQASGGGGRGAYIVCCVRRGFQERGERLGYRDKKSFETSPYGGPIVIRR